LPLPAPAVRVSVTATPTVMPAVTLNDDEPAQVNAPLCARDFCARSGLAPR
jgi:hypothetical protein